MILLGVFGRYDAAYNKHDLYQKLCKLNYLISTTSRFLAKLDVWLLFLSAESIMYFNPKKKKENFDKIFWLSLKCSNVAYVYRNDQLMIIFFSQFVLNNFFFVHTVQYFSVYGSMNTNSLINWTVKIIIIACTIFFVSLSFAC